MTDSKQGGIAGEIADVRARAEEGRDASLARGVMYAIWGGIIGLASLVAYVEAAGLIGLGSFIGGFWFWLATLGVGLGISIFFARRPGLTSGALTIGNKTAGAVWFAVGLFLIIFWISLTFLHDQFSEYGIKPYVLFSMMFPVVFGVYGVAIFVTAVTARLEWMRGFAVAAWVFSVASLYYFGDARQALVGALGSFACALLPGVILMRRAPNETG